MSAMSVLHAMEKYGVTPNADTTDDSTNSGGSLGHAVYVSNQENIEFPDLESKSQWDYTELATWKATTKPFSFNECQNLAKYIPATKVTESSKVAKLAADTGDTNEDTNGISTTEFVNIKGVAKCLGDSLVVGGHQSLWYCIIWFILGSYNVHPSNIQTGPRPWHLQFTAYRTDANDTFPFPIPPGSYADAATLTNGINLCHYNVEEGTITTAGSFDLSTERYLDDAYTLSPAQIARLAPYVHQNASSIAAQVASKYASDTYSAAHSSSQLARKTAVDLPYVVPFTSSFMSMGTGLAKADGTACSTKSPLNMVPKKMYNYGMHLKASTGYAVITDGGDMETTAVVALLRMKKTKLMTVMDGPYNITTKYGLLFGKAEPPHDCSAHHALMDQLKVFDPARWPEVYAALTDRTNKGVHVFKNMAVQANPFLGVEAYTIDQLVIFDNQSKEPFEQEVFTPDALATLKQGGKGYPCDQDHNACGMSDDKAMGTALSLMFQWKVKNNIDILKDVFDV